MLYRQQLLMLMYTGLGRGPYGGRHLGSCPPSGPQFQARGWTSTTFAHCKLTYFIFIIAFMIALEIHHQLI